MRTNSPGGAGVTLRVSEEPIILGLDTSTETRSVAVARGETLLTTIAGEGGPGHSARVLCEVDEALSRCGLRVRDVELFGVASGPGSFTGLRSGMAITLAFASALGRAVHPIPTLHAVAAAAPSGPQVLATTPAGRGEVFAQLLSVGGGGGVVELEGPTHVSPAALLARAVSLRGRVVWCGRWAEGHARGICEHARERGIECFEAAESGAAENVAGGECEGWVLARARGPLAGVIARMTLGEFREGRGRGIEAVRAVYVRAADAELKK